MNESRFPTGWDEQRAKRLIQHHESLTEEEQIAEDDAALNGSPEQTIISVPTDLLPAIRQLLAEYDQRN